jgi:tRNA1Val (adenine37-N6)-methyltransferase
MSLEPFRFKRFTVVQNLCTHKVGTDGVLLGAWVKLRGEDKSILDIGTGCGVIALMLAQKSTPDTFVDAVEIEAMDVQQARENVSLSPWEEKITIHHTALQHFFPEKQYDLIASNPPYFMNSLLPAEEKRSQARHTLQLSHEDLLDHSTRLLKKEGRLAVILPYLEGLRFIGLASRFQLIPLRRTNFRTRPHKRVERLLLELGYSGEPEQDTEIILYSEGEVWSDDYRKVTADFYLNA